MQYSVDDLVRLAKRDNNSIRPYLYVNPLQGKHIPTKPEDILGMCRELADTVNAAYPTDKLYVVGFAETATGIASAVSHYLNNVVFYQNTTREFQEKEDYLYFTESHSHATDQMLRLTGIQESIGKVDRIIFIDDEVTTGNTIYKLFNVIKKKYSTAGIKYSIISILNSMTQERINQLKDNGIECLFLSELPFEYKKDSVMDISYEAGRDTVAHSEGHLEIEKIRFDTKINARVISKFEEYDHENIKFAEMIQGILDGNHYKELLILGTEECMYPAIYLGKTLGNSYIADEVRVHATTRSPIIASGNEGYPLYHRYQLRSLYDQTRNTYVYNLKKYDKVIIVTDAIQEQVGLADLLYALKSVGNQHIMLAQWNYI